MKKLLLLLLPVCCIGQKPDPADSVFIRMMTNDILTDRTMYNNLKYLTKQIGGRLAGSPQLVMAERWGAQAMGAAGPDRVIVQECMIPHWVRGGMDHTWIRYKDDRGHTANREIEVLALGNSEGSGPAGVEAPVLEVHSFDELEQHRDEVKGKIVFFYPPFEETFVHTFDSYGKNVVYRGSAASRAAKYGAVGVCVRSMTNSMDNRAHTGAMNYDPAYQKIPAVAVGMRDVEWLDTLWRAGRVISGKIVTNGRMLPDTIGHNIIGELRGSEFPNEVITIGGHLDSWDVAEGAEDDGTGVVQTIEVLRAFHNAGYHPKHTIRFVLFSNEENGTRGARKYAEAAQAAGEKHIFALESDEGGFAPRGFGLTVPEKSFDKMLTWRPLFEPYDAADFTRGGGGSDIGPLARAFNTPLAGLRPDGQRYFDMHHSKNDVLEIVSPREVQMGAVAMAALVYLVDKYGL